MKTRTMLTAALVTLILLAPLRTFGDTPPDRWTFSVMPYLWLPSVDGNLNYGPPPSGGASADVSIDTDSLLDNLDLAFMINGEARKGRWLIATDVIYLDFSKSDSAVRSVDFNLGTGPINIATTGLNVGTQSSLEALAWTLVGGYTAVQEPSATLDLIGGFRYLGAKARTDWQLTATVTGTGPLGNTATFARTGSVEKSEDILTAIVGAKGRVKLGESKWFVPYYGDIGGGSSTFTWQGAVGIGYAFRWGDVRLDYRYLYYDRGSDKLFQELSFGGFALGVNFVF
jgi:hypothetical protein